MGTKVYDEPNAFTTYGNSYLWPRVDTKDRADYASVGGAVTAGVLAVFSGTYLVGARGTPIEIVLSAAVVGALLLGLLCVWILKRPSATNNGIALALCVPLWIAVWQSGFPTWVGALGVAVVLTAGALGGLRASLALRRFES